MGVRYKLAQNDLGIDKYPGSLIPVQTCCFPPLEDLYYINFI